MEKKTKIPSCIYPISSEVFELKGDLSDIKEKIAMVNSNHAEVFYNTGNDHDFSYTLLNSIRLIIGGQETRKAILAGRPSMHDIPII